MKNQKTKKILKIARLVYDVLSAIFIIFVSVALIVGNNGKQTEKAIKNAINHPVVLEKQPNYLYEDNDYLYLYLSDVTSFDYAKSVCDNFVTSDNISTTGVWSHFSMSAYLKYLDTTTLTDTSASFLYLHIHYEALYNDIRIIFNNSATRTSQSNELEFGFYSTNNLTNNNAWLKYNDPSGVFQSVSNRFYLRLPKSNARTSNFEVSIGGGYTEEDLQREYNEGYANGYDVGSSEGYTEGYADGYDYAIEEMNNRTDALTLAQNYDFRQWIGQVDLVSGAIAYDIPDNAPAISLVYKGMSWLSNGNIYNAIRLTLVRLDSMNALVTNYDITTGQYSGYTAQTLYGEDYGNYCMLTSVAYLHYDSNDNLDLSQVVYEAPVLSDVLVHDVDTSMDYKALAFNLNNNSIDPSYRYLQGIIQEDNNKLDTPVYKNVTLYDLLSMQLTQAVNVGVGDSNIFGLLSQGFNTMANIMSIQIIPNITIGLLLLLPLVVTIIILIFKMVRK